MLHILQDFWQTNTKQNTLYIVIGIILSTLLFRKYLSNKLATSIFNFLQKRGKIIYKEGFFKLLVKPLQQFLVWVIIIFSLFNLYLPKAFTKYIVFGTINFEQILSLVAVIVVVFVFLRFVLSIVEYIAYKLEQKANQTTSQSDNQLILFFKDFVKIILIIIGILLVLKFGLHQSIGALLTGLSIVGVAVALATKESLENLIASFIIFFDKPFEAGDEVNVHQITGVVEKIGLRSTRIRTAQKTFVTVPNKQMVDSIIDNHTLRTSRKVSITLHLNALTTFEQIAQLKTEILEQLKKIEANTTPTIYFSDISKGLLILQIDYTLQSLDYQSFIQSKDATNLMVLQTLQKNNVFLNTVTI